MLLDLAVVGNAAEPAIHQIDNVAARIESGELDPSDLDSMELVLTASMGANPQFRSIVYFDTAYQAAIARRVAPGEIVWELTSAADEIAVVAAITQTLTKDAAFWGEPVFSNGAVHVTRRLRIDVGGEAIGVLVASVTVSELSRLITEFGQAYDGTGFILFGPDHGARGDQFDGAGDCFTCSPIRH